MTPRHTPRTPPARANAPWARPHGTLKNKLGSPTFRESDGALIAKAAYERGLLAKPQGRHRS